MGSPKRQCTISIVGAVLVVFTGSLLAEPPSHDDNTSRPMADLKCESFELKPTEITLARGEGFIYSPDGTKMFVWQYPRADIFTVGGKVLHTIQHKGTVLSAVQKCQTHPQPRLVPLRLRLIRRTRESLAS